MVSLLRISSMLALTLGGILFATAGVRWWREDLKTADVRTIPTVTDRLAKGGDRAACLPETGSPLMVQARAFAEYLSPSASPEAPPGAAPALGEPPQVSSAPPAEPPATLRLHATSCYPDQPERSMALVSETGSPVENQRWVKEGSQFGPFIIHEIRRGGIVYRRDDQMYQAVLDHTAQQPSLVRDLRRDSHRVSAAFEGMVRGRSSPADPNDIDVSSD